MTRSSWGRILPKHVEQAIELLRSEKVRTQPNRSLFLIHQEKPSPLKQTAILSFHIANDLPTAEPFGLTSGQALIEQFQRLGFQVVRKTKAL